MKNPNFVLEIVSVALISLTKQLFSYHEMPNHRGYTLNEFALEITTLESIFMISY